MLVAIIIVLSCLVIGLAAWGHHQRVAGYARTRRQLAQARETLAKIRAEAAPHQGVNPLADIILNTLNKDPQ